MAVNKKSARFIGKIRQMQGSNGDYQVILIDNPSPTDKDGNPSRYHKGNLIWCDAETGEQFVVKQLALKNPSPSGVEHGDINSIMIDLENSYHVDKIEQ